jgi:hypothetical protein
MVEVLVMQLPNMRLKLAGARGGRIAFLAGHLFSLRLHRLAPAVVAPAA